MQHSNDIRQGRQNENEKPACDRSERYGKGIAKWIAAPILLGITLLLACPALAAHTALYGLKAEPYGEVPELWNHGHMPSSGWRWLRRWTLQRMLTFRTA